MWSDTRTVDASNDLAHSTAPLGFRGADGRSWPFRMMNEPWDIGGVYLLAEPDGCPGGWRVLWFGAAPSIADAVFRCGLGKYLPALTNQRGRRRLWAYPVIDPDRRLEVWDMLRRAWTG